MFEDAKDDRALPVPSGRYTRMGRLGGVTAGIAGNMALNGLAQLGQGRRPSMRDLLLTPKNIGRLADELAKMRGAAMKIGQLMSMDAGDVFPPELAQIMARLRDDAHFMPPVQLKTVLNAEWPVGWIRSFQSFDVRPIAAASIGQVHRARLKDGRELAIKVQYPGVAESISSDIANVGALMRMSGLLPKGFALEPYLEAAKEQLHEETDYLREAAHMVAFEERLSDAPHFIVPTYHADWSTNRILSMSFVDGVPIEDVARMSADIRSRVGARLVDLVLDELFNLRHMQTDPNFANYFFDVGTERIALLDFGATRAVSPAVVDVHRRLLRAGLRDDQGAIEAIAEEMEFFDATTAAPHRGEIVDMIRTVFSAIVDRRPFDFGSDKLATELQLRGQRLALDGFVPKPLPFDIVLLHRKFAGIYLLCKRLNVKLDIASRLENYS